jgi:NADH-quinone oxidoreductase subunit D
VTLNIGPQHPSTHGVLRLLAKVDGERISSVQPVIGYMHRGYEKLSEVRTYAQITTLVNRIDWVAGFASEVPYIVAVERLMGVEPPERARWIRLILSEMARIASHLVFMSSYPLELGAITPLFHALRERERVLELIEGLTGGRFHPNFNRVGGEATGRRASGRRIQDVPTGGSPRPGRWTRSLRVRHRTPLSVRLFRRTIGRCHPVRQGRNYSLSGPNMRRRRLSICKVELTCLPRTSRSSAQGGDCAIATCAASADRGRPDRLQAIDKIPKGPLAAKVLVIKVPKRPGRTCGENPRSLASIISRGQRRAG